MSVEDIQRIHNDFFRLLANPNELMNTEELFPLIVEYAECRRQEMGVQKPLHLFLKYPYSETVGNGFRITARRINPNYAL